MPRCRNGHESAETEFCPECGWALDAVTGWDCPNGHGPQVGKYCEECGSDPAAGAPPARTVPRVWGAVVGADRALFDAVGAAEDGLTFPEHLPDRRFTLRGNRMLIGRADPKRGVAPEIDLSGPGEDPAVGRAHAHLVADGDGWAVVDLGSVNETYVNDRTRPIPPNQPVKLADGDRIYLGAWTVITVRVEG